MFKGGFLQWVPYLLTITYLTASSQSSAQILNGLVIPDFETLEWLYEAGIIDKDEFDRWNEFFTDSLHSGRQAVDVTEDAQIEQSIPTTCGKETRISCRIYHRAAERHPYRQILQVRTSAYRRLYFSGNVEQPAAGKAYLRGRTLRWRGGETEVELGDLDPNWSGGLVLGRHPIFLREKSREKSWLYPMKTRFNGVSLRTRVVNASVSALASYDRDRRFSSLVHGLQLEFCTGRSAICVAAVRGCLENTLDGGRKRISLIGGDLKLGHRRTVWCLSLAFDGEGDHACLFSGYDSRKNHRIHLWKYGNGFLNPFGAGRANPDTAPVEIREIGLAYRSRYTNETGVQTRSRFRFSESRRLTIESNWWRTGTTEKLRIKATMEHGLDSKDLVRAILLAGDDNLDRKGCDLYSTFLEWNRRVGDAGSIAVSARGRSRNVRGLRRTLYGLDGRLRTGSGDHHSEVLLRWYDPDDRNDRDHYVYCSMDESLRIGDCWHISVLVSGRFGPDQDTVKTIRIRIETGARF
jgi:hypothetical protein